MSKMRKAVAALSILIVVAMGLVSGFFPGHGSEIKAISMPADLLNTNPVNTQLNVTIGRVSYITQPTEWLYSANSPQPASWVNPTSSWTVNNSGYLFMVNNATSSTAPSPEVVNFPVASALGSTVSYIFTDSRIALNGTGETAYIVISESAQTGVPSTTANTLASSAGSSQNIIFVSMSYSSGTYAVSVGYYAWVLGGNGKGYENYTSYSFSATLQPLWFYDIYINIQPSGTTVSIVNATGSLIATSSTLSPVLAGNLTKVAYISYVHAPAASTSGDMLILDYAYLVDHNVYATSTAGAMIDLPSIVAPFDPGNANANYTMNPNSTHSFVSVNMSSNNFYTITPSSSNATKTSSLINPVYLPPSGATTVYAQNQTTALRTTSENNVTVTASLYITTWTPQGINNAIISFLQNYIASKIGVMPSQVTIISYLITDIGFDMNFAPSTAQMIQNYIYNSAPGIMASDWVSLVNTTTGAVAAGAYIGYFMDLQTGAVAQPIIKGNLIINPFTGAVYNSPMAAGFPVGSEIMNGAIFVPGQYQFYGFASDGTPIFAAGWNPFSGVTGAAQAVQNFFQAAQNTVSNAIGTVSNAAGTVTTYVEKATNPANIQKFTTDLAKATSSVMPFLGGVATDLSKSIGGTLSNTLSNVQNGLASVKNSVVGALATGVTDIKNTIYHIGSTIQNLPSTIQSNLKAGANYVWNTLGKAGSAIGSVISPITTAVKNLPGNFANGVTSIANAAKNGLISLGTSITNAGKNVLNTVGNSLQSAATGVATWLGNAYGQMTAGFINATTGKLAASITTPVLSFFAGLSTTIGHYIIPIIIGGGLIIVLIAFIVIYDRRKHHRHHKSSKHHRR